MAEVIVMTVKMIIAVVDVMVIIVAMVMVAANDEEYEDRRTWG